MTQFDNRASSSHAGNDHEFHEASHAGQGQHHDDACGPAGVCFAADSSTKQVEWKYVGEGYGMYDKVQTFNYVGDGKGTYDAPATGLPWCWRYGWIICLVCLLVPLLFVVPIWFHLVVINNAEVVTRHVVVVPAAPVIFVPTIVQAMDIVVASPAVLPTPAPPPSEPFDCQDASVYTWETSWSKQKQHYCCDYHDIACPIKTTAAPIDCYAGLVSEWTRAKSYYCCGHANIGCPTPVTTPRPRPEFVCVGEQAGSIFEWSPQKRTHCCRFNNIGCPTVPPPATTTPAPYQCNDGNPSDFSPPKAYWCCHHRSVGCTTTPNLGCDGTCNIFGTSGTCRELVQYGAVHEFNWRAQACGQSYTEVRVKCPLCGGCVFTSLTCVDPPTTTSTTTPALFDCNQDDNAIWTKWTPQKRAYCCIMQSKGCATAPPTTLALYDCGVEWQNAAVAWSPTQIDWCCNHDPQKRGCQAPPSFDCNAALATWSWAWSATKKQYCCSTFKKGCPGSEDQAAMRAHEVVHTRTIVVRPGEAGYEQYMQRQGQMIHKSVQGNGEASTKVLTLADIDKNAKLQALIQGGVKQTNWQRQDQDLGSTFVDLKKGSQGEAEAIDRLKKNR